MTDTKQLTADEVLAKLNEIYEYSEKHEEEWRNQVARDLNQLMGRAEWWVETDGDTIDTEFGNAVLRIVERVAGFEKIEKVKRKEPPAVWQENTRENPFWTDSETYHGGPVKPVEVMYKDGTTARLPCPKCARGMFGQVVKWRKIEAKESK